MSTPNRAAITRHRTRKALVGGIPIGGGSPIVVPSSHRDLENPELRTLIDRYYRGSECSAVERIKLLKLAWDAIGTEFGARHELYERNYSGNGEQIRLDALKWATQSGSIARSLTPAVRAK